MYIYMLFIYLYAVYCFFSVICGMFFLFILFFLFLFDVLCILLFFFFFSSRRRHTRFDCDWSSDVCSSDLAGGDTKPCPKRRADRRGPLPPPCSRLPCSAARTPQRTLPRSSSARVPSRSEERRVGKECRSRWSADHEKKKTR